jgi:predicted dehydrogenase
MRKSSRRQFVTENALAIAACALAGTAKTTIAKEAAATKAGDKLRVAVIGVNGRGVSHLMGFGNHPDCVVAAIVDVDKNVGAAKAETIEKQFGTRPKVYTDMREAFDDKSIDIASIATPNHWHSLAAIWAIQAGKDVYVEKPVSHNVAEGRRVVEAARKYQRIVQCGTQSRSMPGMRNIIDQIHGGAIGEVTLARGLCYKPRGPIGARGEYEVPANIDYDKWCGPAPMSPLTRPKLHYDWHWQWDCGNGDLGNQGIHQVDIARWGLGESSLGESVQSIGGRLGYADAGDTPNTQICLYRFGAKTMVFEVRGLKTNSYKEAKIGVIFEGSKGYCVCPSYEGGVLYDNDGKEVSKQFSGSEQLHFDNFVQAVQTRDNSVLHGDILEGHLSSALCHVGNISYRLGEKQSAADVLSTFAADEIATDAVERMLAHLTENNVDLSGRLLTLGPKLEITPDETFAGGRAADANPFLTRNYRPPYIVPLTKDL